MIKTLNTQDENVNSGPKQNQQGWQTLAAEFGFDEATISCLKKMQEGVLVRLHGGLTMGPKIAVSEPSGKFIGFFSIDELDEYALDPSECERRWKEE